MMYGGIDLHSNNSVVAVIDDADRVVAQKRLANDITKIVGFLARWQDQLAGVVVESTYNWYWLVDGLQDAGMHVYLANTAAIKQYEGLKHSGDETDAQHLAHLLRLGILPTGTILPRGHRALRDLARKRMQLVQSCTTHILAVENIMARQFGGRMTSNQIKRLTDDTIDSLPLAADVSLAIKANVAVIATLQSQIDVLEKRLQERVRPRPQYRLLTSVPGIGQTLATVILLEAGPIDRFADVGNFASYARCVDSVHTSNRKKKGEGNVKNGNKYLAWAFVEAANFARRFCPEAKRFHERKKARTNNVVATKALAHKLARASYHILKEGKPFEVTRCFA
ncbi:IS110 family transposase [Bradyrhizobium sp. CCGUVB23]|uniref:IS110 family transposase n=1 Tax=Bradyrhizobium sp. CCGUVB23 TaxID=2949630 RepID=UPI0020B1C421|nr:IS110 family transposase [Bradyrhizobium sp. CCGUVB23]MCP3459324.1 IS110 family transposase [Bradyrhizobium sp. CCGUVB23]MCP3460170.1 IS110 family transposase [Bradyrhizobium sp. CCGUVB23]MCP3465794.1 IS110 family transposase [Bradyrhizobium sp. CCGUVB23]MCP3466787.1 IS110 family transposase [Bradyrhizobium sp. CCGUVB23]